MERLTQGYEKFIKNKEVVNNGKALFDKATTTNHLAQNNIEHLILL